MASVQKNVFIFLGPELGKKQDALDSAEKKFKGAEKFNFYANETPAGTIADTLQNMNLFNEKRIVIVKNAEFIKKKDEMEILSSCVKNMEESAALVFISDENKLASGLEDALMKAGVPKTNKQVFYELFEREKNEWVRQFFKNEGYEIDRDGISVILELVENNTSALRQECSRLIGFLPKDRPVNPKDIDRWISHNREESAFTLFSRIASGDMTKSLESMSVMLMSKESSQSIFAGLAWSFRKLGDYIALSEESGNPDSFELKKIGILSPMQKDNYAAAAKRYTAEDAEKCLALTAEYSILMRSQAAALENILMDKYIISIFKSASNNHQLI
ncbi:MAG: DNA polymerase III subunit delta [Treponema sp.]|nr:DNA polymerase III subunit delta [Treponema sp.]MCL2271760.1 DNA polymerase III subunit delta [Treponema sp.]